MLIWNFQSERHQNLRESLYSLYLDSSPSSFLSGPPDKFCINRVDGWYGDPSDLSKYFSCSKGIATPCQQCPQTLTFHAECVQCLREGEKCPMTKPTTKTTTKLTTKPTTKPTTQLTDQTKIQCKWHLMNHNQLVWSITTTPVPSMFCSNIVKLHWTWKQLEDCLKISSIKFMHNIFFFQRLDSSMN